MLTKLFPHPQVITFSTTRRSSLDDLKNLPELAGTQFVSMEQTHSAEHQVVTEERPQTLLDTDAVITTWPGVTLAVKHADCLPILLYHPKGIIGAIHAGRRGTQQKILKKTLRRLKLEFGISEGVQLWFGPAICVKCHTTNLEKTKFFDLLKENQDQAHSIFPGETCTIAYADRCTVHENHDFFSYRADGKGVPMNWSVISLATQKSSF